MKLKWRASGWLHINDGLPEYPQDSPTASTHVSWEDYRRLKAILCGEERTKSDRVVFYTCTRDEIMEILPWFHETSTERYPDPPYLAIAETNGKILAAAIRMPPYKLVLSKAEDLNALGAIALPVS